MKCIPKRLIAFFLILMSTAGCAMYGQTPKNTPFIMIKAGPSEASSGLMDDCKSGSNEDFSRLGNYRSEIQENIFQGINQLKDIVRAEVCVEFAINADGSLDYVRIKNDLTTLNQTVQNNIQTIFDHAAPFPPIPEYLNVKQLILRLPIIFKMQADDLLRIPGVQVYKDYLREELKKIIFEDYVKNADFKGVLPISIVLLNNGKFKRLEDHDLMATSYREFRPAVIKSLKKISPFKPFPDDLKDVSELKFNLILEY